MEEAQATFVASATGSFGVLNLACEGVPLGFEHETARHLVAKPLPHAQCGLVSFFVMWHEADFALAGFGCGIFQCWQSPLTQKRIVPKSTRRQDPRRLIAGLSLRLLDSCAICDARHQAS